MNLVEFAANYVRERGISRTPIYSANRFARLIGDVPVSSIDDASLLQFRNLCEAEGLSTWTIKCGLKDLRTLVRAAGQDVRISKIRTPDPDPQPVPLGHIDAVWPFLKPWSQQWLALSFWTALRLSDVILLQSVIRPGDRIEWEASKTKRRQRWPVPAWLKPLMEPVHCPYGKCPHNNKVIVRAELDRVSTLAGIPRFLPSQVRDASLTEWCRADARVGEILHGCRLGVIGHYVDPCDIIAPVGHRVRLPTCFDGGTNTEDIGPVLAKLDPDAKRIVREMAVRLAK